MSGSIPLTPPSLSRVLVTKSIIFFEKTYNRGFGLIFLVNKLPQSNVFVTFGIRKKAFLASSPPLETLLILEYREKVYS